MQNNVYITSSEIGEFVYCPRGWWLRQNWGSETTPQMVKGTAAHNNLSWQLTSLGIKKIIIFVLGFLVISLIITLILYSYILKL